MPTPGICDSLSESLCPLGTWEFPMPLRRLPSRQRSAEEPTKPFDPKAFLANPSAGRTLRHYKPKQAVFSRGERADTAFYIQDGTVRLSVASTHGKEAIIALLGAGDFLGEGCIASDQPVRIATATAVTKCSVLRIENREMLRNAFDADPAREGRRGGGSDPRHKSADPGGNDTLYLQPTTCAPA
jgi:Cyclic nucleotide-binding domain